MTNQLVNGAIEFMKLSGLLLVGFFSFPSLIWAGVPKNVSCFIPVLSDSITQINTSNDDHQAQVHIEGQYYTFTQELNELFQISLKTTAKIEFKFSNCYSNSDDIASSKFRIGCLGKPALVLTDVDGIRTVMDANNLHYQYSIFRIFKNEGYEPGHFIVEVKVGHTRGGYVLLHFGQDCILQ